MTPAHSPLRGALALARSSAAAAARALGLQRLFDWANRPVMALSDMQPVTAKWWRERGKQPGEFFYLALGDSTAQGIGASTPGRSYVGQLADRIEQRLGAPARVVNLGFSGATSWLYAATQMPRAVKPLTQKPDLVTVALGANDIADWDPVRFHRSMSRILDAAPDHTIVGEVPCFFIPANERRVAQANAILHAVCAARGLAVVPLHEATRRRGLRGVLTEFADDAFHPTDLGYEAWADAFWPAVARRVDERLAETAASVVRGTATGP